MSLQQPHACEQRDRESKCHRGSFHERLIAVFMLPGAYLMGQTQCLAQSGRRFVALAVSAPGLAWMNAVAWCCALAATTLVLDAAVPDVAIRHRLWAAAIAIGPFAVLGFIDATRGEGAGLAIVLPAQIFVCWLLLVGPDPNWSANELAALAAPLAVLSFALHVVWAARFIART